MLLPTGKVNSMRQNRCAGRCRICEGVDRRGFIVASLGTVGALSAPWLFADEGDIETIRSCGPASRCVPVVKACFVRREGSYGMWWPGAIYDGQAAKEKYTQLVEQSAKQLGFRLDLRPTPLFNLEEAAAWVAEAKQQAVDGLLVVLLDRQEHAWPTAELAIDSGIRTVVFSPIGTSFTTNTTEPSKKRGCFICSTDHFPQVHYGLKMLCAAKKLAATRCVVLAGNRRDCVDMPHLGITLQYVPAQDFLDEYQRTPVTDRVKAMAAELIGGARRMIQATEQDVINGIKSYLVAVRILQREEGDAISMDCLGALGNSDVSLPCIAWSKMNDDGIPAACEADRGAIASHCVVQYLFDRPGFQQDPVAETVKEAVVGAHCSCPTRLHGFGTPPEPYDIQHHHGVRDATARTIWKTGQRITCLDVLPGSEGEPTKMLISAGEVLDNVSVPPAGGCVVSVTAKFDNVQDVLAFPGFHQLFFYGDFKRELVQFCRLIDVEPVVV